MNIKFKKISMHFKFKTAKHYLTVEHKYSKAILNVQKTGFCSFSQPLIGRYTTIIVLTKL